MALKTEVTSQGIVTTKVAGSTDTFKVLTTPVENSLTVAAAATGTITTENLVITEPGALIVLPSEPVVGFTVKIINVVDSTDPIGVTGSHSINNDEDAIDISGSFFSREFIYASAAGWFAGADGSATGVTGTFSF